MPTQKFLADSVDNLRDRAERFLNKTGSDLNKISLSEIQKLVREMQEYQGELDTQNEELRETLKNLEGVRSRYADLYDFAPVGYFTLDRSGLVLEVNLTGAGLLGKERTSIIHTSFYLQIAPQFRTLFHKHLQEVFADTAKRSCTLQLLTAEGTTIQVALESLAVEDHQGNLSQCHIVVSDITAHQKAVEALRLTQFVVDRASVAIFWAQPDGKLLYVNQAACEGLGHSREELLNLSMTDIDPEISTEIWLDRWEELKRINTNSFRGVHCRKDGSRFPVELSVNYLQFGDREFQIVFATDITVRKRAEEEIKTAVTYLENIIASSADPIATVNEQGRFTRWNRAAEQVYGYTAHELTSQTAFKLYPDQAALEKMMSQLRRNGFVQGYEIDMKKKDGCIAPFSLSIRLLRDEKGKTLGSVCVARDLTETKQSMEELNSTNAKLRVLVEESDRRNRELTLINSMAEKLQSCLAETEAYPIIGQHVQNLFPAKSGALFIRDSANNLLEAIMTWGDSLTGDLVFPPADCWALRRGRINLGGEPPLGLPCRHVPDSHPGNYLCLPLQAHNEPLGMLHIQGLSDLNEKRPEQLKTLAVTVGDHISLALVNLKLRETLRHQVVHDALTGLYNRRYLEETLEREIYRVKRKWASLGLIMLDLDHFKRFNDNYGHEAGDDLLRTLGKFLASRVRQEDVACRYGGEEFVLILPEASIEVVKQRAEDIRRGFPKLQIFYRGRVIESVTVSLGIAMFPDDGDTGQDVLRAADDAMYQAKAQGRNRVVVAEAQMRTGSGRENNFERTRPVTNHNNQKNKM
jgi:diguanylate cyclase (GGDEF)-like protein/PAS domain S-box-containing protein